MTRRRPRHRARHRGLRSRVSLAALAAFAALVVAVGIAAVVVLVPSSGGTTASRSPAPPERPLPTARGSAPSPAGGAAPGQDSRSLAATVAHWVTDELAPDAHLVAPPTLAGRLRDAGIPGDRLSTATAAPSGGASPPFLVTDGAAPAGGRVLARFEGTGGSPVIVVDPSPGTPTPEELDLRHSLAAAILANPTTRVPEPAAGVLRSGDVDPRLLSLLAALAARSGVGLAAFPAAPGAPAGVLARHALVDSVGGEPVRPGSPAADDLLAWLRAQLPPYAPDSVTVTAAGALIGYRYVSDPDAEVHEATR